MGVSVALSGTVITSNPYRLPDCRRYLTCCFELVEIEHPISTFPTRVAVLDFVGPPAHPDSQSLRRPTVLKRQFVQLLLHDLRRSLCSRVLPIMTRCHEAPGSASIVIHA